MSIIPTIVKSSDVATANMSFHGIASSAPKNLCLHFARNHPDAKLPYQANPHDAGYDVATLQDEVIEPHQRKLISTGVYCIIPAGYFIKVEARSGKAVKCGEMVGAGVIDSPYRGEIKVLIYNNDPTTAIKLEKGERFAQLICQKIFEGEVVFHDELDEYFRSCESIRSVRGFGSTGEQ